LLDPPRDRFADAELPGGSAPARFFFVAAKRLRHPHDTKKKAGTSPAG
jgi:hypothetical protein